MDASPRSLLTSLVSYACGSRCAGCGRSGRPTPCRECRRTLERSPRTPDAWWLDDGVARRLVRAAKYGHWRGGGRTLARLGERRLRLVDHDLVTWIPADRTRRAVRGTHLPEQLAHELARASRSPSVALLERRAGSSRQQGLDRAARRRNAGRSWRLRADVGRLDGLHILLVDDVRTTGATLDAAAAMLRARGARVSTHAVVARHSRDRSPDGVLAGTGIPAHSEEFLLTNRDPRADTVGHGR
jgi:predicted amidophosphoribosyltransferase